MGELRLFAIGIDEARDMFSASPELAERLRASVAPLFPPPPHKRRRRDLLGPLIRTSLLPASDVPLPGDAENLLAGHFVTPDRIPAAWMLVERWLHELSWGDYTTTLTPGDLETWDFDLARAGMSATYSVAALLTEDLGFPLRPLPGRHTGYTRHGHVVAATVAWTECLEQLPGPSRTRMQELVAWLDGFAGWTSQAEATQRPVPDLVGLLTW